MKFKELWIKYKCLKYSHWILGLIDTCTYVLIILNIL